MHMKTHLLQMLEAIKKTQWPRSDRIGLLFGCAQPGGYGFLEMNFEIFLLWILLVQRFSILIRSRMVHVAVAARIK